ncbi:centrosomal protein of 78 kDa isoform X1 [Takifugu rubripes]|uniref:Centrosomal protein 78 n=1 Tax=Takifugu rubripes TaxID=31033 RepID=H2V0V6_TAKRU|nr:centrosomal protein of 78 kDa isoform X1 [Takifugu rubripes]XP_011613801.1 centrosomal protein of 78 kDa isoform X1 [Takifugu rubripes]XP_011613802.1 centrosomal protein of 78 kDa isoform X1 [Takifugu rubripes]XP_011613803.1 centrosomal protein of 78 kDa isoform X1 [Takifugu rubripes]|eukprot:XP_011613800.1 PREDICTED: centrosomal protein of 78 kDa isoform X1 [Takifugu rubripes]
MMVQDYAQIQQRAPHHFLAHYENACAKQDSIPLSAIKMHLDKEMLDFNGDRVTLQDWPPLLSSICINKHLHHIAISSTYHPYLGSGDTDRRYYKPNVKKIKSAIRSKEMTFKLCKALRECLTISPKLKTLHLNGLPLRERDLIALSKGLAKSVSLENLSLADCPISDEGLEVICQSVKYSTSIRTLDFTGCNVTWRGAEHMANIVKYQGMQRHGTAWAESLRYRRPQFKGMGGLRRITLNCNLLIGDRGAAALAHELQEDLWVKAVDLQKCGLSNEGAQRLLEALKTNSTLHVLDIRNNALIARDLIKTVIEKVLINADKQPSEYCWIQPAEPKRAPGPKLRAVRRTAKATTRMSEACHKRSSPRGSRPGVPHAQRSHSRACHVPWRAAARAGRERGMSPGASVRNPNLQGASSVKVTVESDSDGQEDEEVVGMKQRSLCLQDKVYTGKLQMELKECRLMLAEERTARLKAESRLTEYELENARLRNANFSLSKALAASGPPAVSALDDEAVLESIEKSFRKFHAFLDLLRDAGLGQLASVAGIDGSDFQPLGRPQFSSTMEPPVGVAPSLIGGDHQTGITSDATALKSSILPAGAVAPQSPPSDRESRPPSFSPDFRPTADPAHTEDQEPVTYSKPVTPLESCSEHSSCRQKSLDKVYFAKKSQSNHSKSDGSSNRSSGSRGLLSGRSSISELFSDKAESVGSHRSRKSGKGVLREVGSGSEGVRYSSFSGLNVEEMSDNDSF